MRYAFSMHIQLNLLIYVFWKSPENIPYTEMLEIFILKSSACWLESYGEKDETEQIY